MCLVRRDIILAVVNAVTDLGLRYTAMIFAGKLTVGTRWITTVLLVAAIPTIVLVIAFPRFKDTPAIVATKFIRATRMIS